MKVLVLTPPVANPFYPPLGLATLRGFVNERAAARHQCAIADLSIEAFQFLLTSDFLASCLKTVESRFAAFAAEQNIEGLEIGSYSNVCESLLRAGTTVAGISEALEVFRDTERFGDSNLRRTAQQRLEAALALISAAYPPFEVNMGELRAGAAPFSLDATIRVLHHAQSPFYQFLFERIQTLLVRESPDCVGVSICYYGQLLAGLEVLKILRDVSPSTPTLVGGSLMPEVGVALRETPAFDRLIDYLVCYEGESALIDVLDDIQMGHVSGGVHRREIRNLVAFKEGAVRVRNRHREDVSGMPIPDFGGLDLSLYLSPSPVLPLLTSRGCYWGKCAFCTHFHTYGEDYRMDHSSWVVKAMEALGSRHNTSYFYFVDESLAPSRAISIADGISKSGLNVRWGTEIRFERALTSDIIKRLAESGCAVLSFGLESASQRVLDRMRKGIKVETAARIVRDAHWAGIAVHVMCIVGFPGEEKADVDKTLAFLEAHKQHLALIGFSPFTLNKNSIVDRMPEHFGVVPTGVNDPFRPDRNYEVREGLSQIEVHELFEAIECSHLVRGLYERTAVPTREHLLFLSANTESHCSSRSSHRVTQDSRVYTDDSRYVLRSLPFSISDAARFEHLFKSRTRRASISTTANSKAVRLERAQGVTAIHTTHSNKLFEVSRGVQDILQLCSGGRSVCEISERLVEQGYGNLHDLQPIVMETIRELAVIGVVDIT